MLEPIYLLLCSRVIVDSVTGAMSLIDLIDMVAMPDPPPSDRDVLAALDFYIVSGWRRGGETPPAAFPVRFALVGPAPDRRVPLGEQQVRLDPNHLGGAAARVQGLPLRGPGQYRVEVEWLDPQTKAWRSGPWAGLWIPTQAEVRALEAQRASAPLP